MRDFSENTLEKPAEYGVKIKAELIKNMYQQWHGILVGVLTTATGVSFIFYDNISDTTLFTWLFSVYILTYIRHLSVKRFKTQDYEPATVIKWGWIFAFFTFMSGLVWGAASILFFSPDNLQLFNLLTLIIIAMCVGSLGALSSYPLAYIVFVLPAISPMIWRYMNIDNQDYQTFSALLFVFILALFYFAKVNHKMLRQSVELRFENADLIEQLTAQKEKAEQANIAKTKFLAAASHDLRQPLHAIGLFLGALFDKVEKDDQKIIITKIQKSSDALNSLLDSLLDISKLDAGVIHTENSPFSINSLFDSLKNEFEAVANEKKLRLKFINNDIWINSDFKVLERITRNLLSNAIRYTNKGGVVVGCRHFQGQILLTVYDTGVGIREDKIDLVFEEFYQLDNPERDRSKGLGLGLAIVKRMAKLLNISLLVKSNPNKGSMFGLLIPGDFISNPINMTNQTLFEPLFFDQKCVLVVDDEKEIRDSLAGLLRSWHCKVLTASSGKEAIKILSKNSKPDIILADYRLRNNETGNDVINKVKILFSDHKISSVIITGDTAPDRIQEANTSGYKTLHKPVSPNELRLLLGRIFNRTD